MTYLNPVLAYGVERFLADATAAGASGLLLTDFPAGSDPALEASVDLSALALDPGLIAPTTTAPARLAHAPRACPRRMACLSRSHRLGVTGCVRDAVPPDPRLLLRGADARGHCPRRWRWDSGSRPRAPRRKRLGSPGRWGGGGERAPSKRSNSWNRRRRSVPALARLARALAAAGRERRRVGDEQ